MPDLANLSPDQQLALRSAIDAAGGDLTSRTSAFFDRLRRAAAAAAASNPEKDDVATGVALTINAAGDGTLTKVYTAAANQTLFRAAGGKATAGGSGSAYLYFPVASNLPATNGNVGTVLTATPDVNEWAWSASFETDSDKVQIEVNSATSLKHRVLVDGRYVSKTPAAGINFVAFLNLDFAGVRRPRVITVEGAGTDALRRVAVVPTSSIWRPMPQPDAVVALITGDSYGESQGATTAHLGYAPILGRLMGWSDVRQVAVGGTGYLNTGGGLGRSIIRDQIPRWLSVNSDLAATDIDVVVAGGGYNDVTLLNSSTITTAQLQAEALYGFALMRATCPRALIAVFGCSAGSRGPDANTLAAETAIRAAFLAWGDPRSLFVPVSADTTPWITGTGKVGSTNGSGNSDVMVAADGIHPADLGHFTYGRRGASAIRAALKAMP